VLDATVVPGPSVVPGASVVDPPVSSVAQAATTNKNTEINDQTGALLLILPPHQDNRVAERGVVT
jgi:hypothetical protein